MRIFYKRIDEIQKDDDEYFVYLKYGFQIQEGLHHSPVHCFGERTIHDIKETMKDVSICKCNECENNKPD